MQWLHEMAEHASRPSGYFKVSNDENRYKIAMCPSILVSLCIFPLEKVQMVENFWRGLLYPMMPCKCDVFFHFVSFEALMLFVVSECLKGNSSFLFVWFLSYRSFRVCLFVGFVIVISFQLVCVLVKLDFVWYGLIHGPRCGCLDTIESLISNETWWREEMKRKADTQQSSLIHFHTHVTGDIWKRQLYSINLLVDHK